MSQMPTFLRAYRQGLRDVQRAVLVYGCARSEPWSNWSAVRVAADWICIPLRNFRDEGTRSLDADIRRQMAVVCSDETDFVRGYKAGFDHAVQIVQARAHKMNNPGARNAINEAVERLQRIRTRMNPNERGRIRTLRAAKFVI